MSCSIISLFTYQKSFISFKILVFTCSELPFVFRHYPIHIVLCMERVVWRTASLIDMHTYSDSYSYLINISVCFIIRCTCIISFRFQYFPASCAERNLNPIENGKKHLNSRPHERMRVLCAFWLSKMEKKKSPRWISDFRVHVTDSHMAEKRILSNGLPSDLISFPRRMAMGSG